MVMVLVVMLMLNMMMVVMLMLNMMTVKMMMMTTAVAASVAPPPAPSLPPNSLVLTPETLNPARGVA